jgi:hypothetical protein
LFIQIFVYAARNFLNSRCSGASRLIASHSLLHAMVPVALASNQKHKNTSFYSPNAPFSPDLLLLSKAVASATSLDYQWL